MAAPTFNPWFAHERAGVVAASSRNAIAVSAGGKRGTRFSVTGVALSGETLRGTGARKAHIFTMLVTADVQKAVVPSATAQLEFSHDKSRVYVEAMSKDMADIKRNKEQNLTGPQAKVRRHHAEGTVIERGSVLTMVCLAETMKTKPVLGMMVEADVTEVDLSPFGGGANYEYQISDVRNAFGSPTKLFYHALEPREYASTLVAAYEAAHNMRTPVPIVYAAGYGADNSRGENEKTIALDKLDVRSRAMFGGEWVVPLRATPPELDAQRRALGQTLASVVVLSYKPADPSSWPSVEFKDGKAKARDLASIDLSARHRRPRVKLGPSDVLPGAIGPDTEDVYYEPPVYATISLTAWGDCLGGGLGVMDQEQWQRLLRPLLEGMPGVARCYCKRNTAASAWPDDATQVGFELSACGAAAKGLTNFKADDNNGLMAFIGVGVFNAGYRVSHADAVAAMQSLAAADPARYAVDMSQIRVDTRVRPLDGEVQHPNALETMKGATGRQNVLNLREGTTNLNAPGLDTEYYYLFVPNYGTKQETPYVNSDTGETEVKASPALAWYRAAAADGNPDAAAGAVLLKMADASGKIGVPAFERPPVAAGQPAAAKHDFLLFAVRRAWADALRLDPLSVDNERTVVADFLAAEKRVPATPATADALREFVTRRAAPGGAAVSSSSGNAPADPARPQLPDNLFDD